MRLGRAGAIGAARARARKTQKEQEMVLSVAQSRAANRAAAASREGERHNDLEFNPVNGRDSSVEKSNNHAGSRAGAENSESERDPPTGSIIKGSTSHDM